MLNIRQEIFKLRSDLNRLRSSSDEIFKKIVKEYPGTVSCKNGCTECCHALFDLMPIESLAIVVSFKKLSRLKRREAIRRAKKSVLLYDKAMMEIKKIERERSFFLLSKFRVPCPLLDKKKCLLYSERPIICRLYGIPIKIREKSHTCHKSLFTLGKEYPTVFLHKINNQLKFLSNKIPFEFLRDRLDIGRVIQLIE